MNRPTRQFRPGASSLEPRSLLSAAAVQPSSLLHARNTTRQDGLSGSLTGRYLATSLDNRPADAPLTIRLDTAGNLANLGRTNLRGAIDFGGFRMTGTADVTGTVTLSNHKGSLTIQVTGSGGHGTISGRSFTLDASIIQGTGDYANVRGIGTLTARFGPNTARPHSPDTPIGGGLSLSLNLRPPVR